MVTVLTESVDAVFDSVLTNIAVQDLPHQNHHVGVCVCVSSSFSFPSSVELPTHQRDKKQLFGLIMTTYMTTATYLSIALAVCIIYDQTCSLTNGLIWSYCHTCGWT